MPSCRSTRRSPWLLAPHDGTVLHAALPGAERSRAAIVAAADGHDPRGVGSIHGMGAQVTECLSCGSKNRVPLAASGHPRCAKCHTDLPWVVDAGDDDVGAALRAKQLVLVDLWAPWCGPCRMVAPALVKLAGEFASALKVVKINVDEAPATAQRYDARSIPTLLFVRDGNEIDRIIGAQPEHVLRTVVQRHISAKGTPR